jgi:hypothetical protein
MPKFNLVVIAGERRLTEFMQRADMFEPFKVLAHIYELSAETTPKSDAEGKGFLDALAECRSTLEQDGIRVVACFIPNEPQGAYVDHTVKVISDGEKFLLLDDALKAYGYAGEKFERFPQPV